MRYVLGEHELIMIWFFSQHLQRQLMIPHQQQHYEGIMGNPQGFLFHTFEDLLNRKKLDADCVFQSESTTLHQKVQKNFKRQIRFQFQSYCSFSLLNSQSMSYKTKISLQKGKFQIDKINSSNKNILSQLTDKLTNIDNFFMIELFQNLGRRMKQNKESNEKEKNKKKEKYYQLFQIQNTQNQKRNNKIKQITQRNQQKKRRDFYE